MRGTPALATGVMLANRLVGLVVKASASRVEDPEFESRLRRDFSGLIHTSDLKLGTPVATLPGTCRGRGHDGLVKCVRTGMSKNVSISKTFVAANAMYSHKFAGHEALVSTFVATYEYSPVIFSVVGISRNR